MSNTLLKNNKLVKHKTQKASGKRIKFICNSQTQINSNNNGEYFYWTRDSQSNGTSPTSLSLYCQWLGVEGPEHRFRSLGCQSACDLNHKPSSSPPLISAGPVVTFSTEQHHCSFAHDKLHLTQMLWTCTHISKIKFLGHGFQKLEKS